MYYFVFSSAIWVYKGKKRRRGGDFYSHWLSKLTKFDSDQEENKHCERRDKGQIYSVVNEHTSVNTSGFWVEVSKRTLYSPSLTWALAVVAVLAMGVIWAQSCYWMPFLRQ